MLELGPGMSVAILSLNLAHVQLGVDLGGRNLLVDEEFLNGSEVGSTFQQVDGVAVAQCVRADAWWEACFLTDGSQALVGGLSHQGEAAVGEDEERAGLLEQLSARFLDISAHPFGSFAGQGDHAGLPSFARDAEHFIVEVQPIHGHGERLADSEAGSIDQLEKGAIAQAFGRLRVGSI